MNDEFYVGYAPQAPRNLGRWIIRISAALVIAGLAVGGMLVLEQPPFATSNFEYGVYRDYTGVLEDWPYPILRTRDGSFLLVAPGKHGLNAGSISGQQVRLEGSLISRAEGRMLEVKPESLQVIGPGEDAPAQSDLGTVTLRGEIVDTKCYLGVMNPGNGKVHRDCAARCISGGAPPAFVVTDAGGDPRVLLLTGSNGRRLNREVLDYVAEPLEIHGRLVRSGANLVLKAEPEQFRRNPE